MRGHQRRDSSPGEGNARASRRGAARGFSARPDVQHIRLAFPSPGRSSILLLKRAYKLTCKVRAWHWSLSFQQSKRQISTFLFLIAGLEGQIRQRSPPGTQSNACSERTLYLIIIILYSSTPTHVAESRTRKGKAPPRTTISPWEILSRSPSCNSGHEQPIYRAVGGDRSQSEQQFIC